MTRRAATPEEPGPDEEHEDASAFLGDWLARTSARGGEPQPVERPVPRPTPEPDPPVVVQEAAVPADPPHDPPPDPLSDQPAAPEQTDEQTGEETGGQDSFDFGAFYSSLDTGSESRAAAPADQPGEVATPAGAHAARGRGLFRRRARSQPTSAPTQATDDSGPSDPPPTRPDPSVPETPAEEPILDDLPPVPPPDYGSFYERLLGAKTGEAQDPDPVPDPEPVAEPEPEPEPVTADPEPARPEPDRERWAADAFTARTPFVAPLDEPQPEPVPEPEPQPQAVHHLRTSKITPAPSATPPPPPAVPQVVEFPRPRGPRILLTVLLLVTGTAAAVAIWQAAQTEAGYNVGIAGALTALTLVFWWGLTTSPMQQVAVRGGILEIEDRESHFTFDLRNPATRVDVEGTPGSRDWKVTIYRHRLSPYVLTRRTVDSERFSEVLEHYRATARKAEEQRLQQRPR